jgi:hypothetical protein
MFSIEEINDFKVEANKLFSSWFDKETAEGMVKQFQFEIALNHDAKFLEAEIRKYLNSSFDYSHNEDFIKAIVKGTTVFNYKSKISEFLANRAIK